MFTSEEPGLSPPGIIVVGPERPGSGLYLNTTLYQHIRVRVEDVRDGASEEQGLLLLIGMDVVELVPSVSFRPRTNVNGWMSDRTSKVRR